MDYRNAHSRFYRAIHISYPNVRDLAQARKLGVAPGGDIYLHGLPNGYGWVGDGHRLKDGTDGCIAVTNEEMDEIWRTRRGWNTNRNQTLSSDTHETHFESVQQTTID